MLQIRTDEQSKEAIFFHVGYKVWDYSTFKDLFRNIFCIFFLFLLSVVLLTSCGRNIVAVRHLTFAVLSLVTSSRRGFCIIFLGDHRCSWLTHLNPNRDPVVLSPYPNQTATEEWKYSFKCPKPAHLIVCTSLSTSSSLQIPGNGAFLHRIPWRPTVPTRDFQQRNSPKKTSQMVRARASPHSSALIHKSSLINTVSSHCATEHTLRSSLWLLHASCRHVGITLLPVRACTLSDNITHMLDYYRWKAALCWGCRWTGVIEHDRICWNYSPCVCVNCLVRPLTARMIHYTPPLQPNTT